jgi:DNA repair photolyase
MEPLAAVPEDRVEAICEAHNRGIRTWVSLEPVFEPADALAWIEDLADCVDLFKVGTLNHSSLAKEIDWRQFGIEAIALFERLGKPYWIKHDLAKHLTGVTFHNWDTRMVD